MAKKKKTAAKPAAPKAPEGPKPLVLPNSEWVTDCQANIDVRVAFPMPYLEIEWTNVDVLNAGLELALHKERVRDKEGIYRSNTAGTWHSDTDLFQRLGEPMTTLKQMFANGFEQMALIHKKKPGYRLGWDLRAWGMMYSDRGYATPHNHPNCHFSGVYYVRDAEDQIELTMATGDKVRPGTLEFLPPIQHDVWAEWANLAPSARVKPKEGKMVIFPSWLFHFVHPVKGDDIRIAIACNASVKRYEKPQPKED